MFESVNTRIDTRTDGRRLDQYTISSPQSRRRAFGSGELKIRNFIFYGKMVTSLAYIFAMEKALVKILFGCKFFICQPISKIFVALFKTFGKKRMMRSHFAGGISEQGDMQNGSFQRMV